MSKVKAPLLGFEAQGTIAKSITFARTKQGTIAKRIPTHLDAHTLPQLYQRWRFIDARYYWHALTQAQRDAYETAARPYHMTGWSYFLRQYLPNPTDQILWLRLDWESGEPGRDFSGKGNHGTIYGTSPATGKIAGALSFDGLDDWVSVNDASSLKPTSAITIMGWVKALDRLGDTHIITSKWTGYLLAFTPWNGIYLVSAYINCTDGAHAEATSTPVDMDWHHAALTYDSEVEGNNELFYVDGSLSNSWAASGSIVNTTAELRVGRNWADAYSNAIVDDVRIYNRALSAEQIKYIATQELWPLPSG